MSTSKKGGGPAKGPPGKDVEDKAKEAKVDKSPPKEASKDETGSNGDKKSENGDAPAKPQSAGASTRDGALRILQLAQKGEWPPVDSVLKAIEKAVASGGEDVNIVPLAGILDPATGMTPLMYAVKDNRTSFVDRMIELGSDVGARNNDNYNVLHISAMYSREDVVKLLLSKRGVDPYSTGGSRQQTAVHLVASRQTGTATSILRALLAAAGKDIRLKVDGRGKIPLLLAVEAGNQSMCRELLGAQTTDQLKATTANGDTALHLAARRRDVDMVRILVDYGTNVDIQNGEGQTALHIASAEGDETLVKYFYGVRASASITDNQGLERVAEELMGRRKWKLYQESLTKSSSIASLLANNLNNQQLIQEHLATSTIITHNNNSSTNTSSSITSTVGTTTTPATTTAATTNATSPATAAATDTTGATTTTILNNNNLVKTENDINNEADEGLRTPTPSAVVLGDPGTTADGASAAITTTNCSSSKLEERLRHPPTTPDQNHQHQHQHSNVATTFTSSGEILEVRDWSPSEKCLFCVDGKLDSRDSETPFMQGSALSPQGSDSETSDNSHSDTETPPHPHNLPTLAATLSPQQLLQNNSHSNMATIESVHSMAVSLAAVAAMTNNNTLAGGPGNPPLSFYPPALLSPWYLNNIRNFNLEAQTGQRRLELDVPTSTSPDKSTAGGQQQQQQSTSHTTNSTASEQPLDLSSKSSSSSSTATGNHLHHAALGGSGVLDPSKLGVHRMTGAATIDNKHIFKAKPRMSTVTGRRTYTEDELQAALRDIQSGKLGTRRAAVIYGIPRSTLRNKVYKLAMERQRENHLVSSAAPVKIEDEEAVAEEKELSGDEEEKEVEKELQKPILSMDDILRFSTLGTQNSESLKHLLQKGNSDDNELLAGLEQSRFRPYLQSILLRASSELISGHKSEELMNAIKLPEMVKKLLAEDLSASEQHTDGINNGCTTERSLSRQSSTNSVIIRNDKIPPMKSGTPEVIDTETNDSTTTHPQTTSDSPSNVILKIPSFKPTTSKNGGEMYRHSPSVLDSTQLNALNITSPLHGGAGNESNSPPAILGKGIMSLKDVIAKSISQKFQQSSPNDQMCLKMSSTSPVIDLDFNSLKRGRFTPPLGGGISVIKNHQQDMLARQFPQPPKPQNNSSSSNSQQQSAIGGKGTRPKRGKYRNYDRDSLVEAVRAVQRGEMSVHRAGSYYGVPHSTLEYKVKERHLMRPRKRDPKPQPTDDSNKTVPAKPQEQIRNLTDKNKSTNIKPPAQKFSPTSPNGLKMPLFDPSMTPIGYNHPPFPFWPHPTFHHMQMPSTSGFPPHPDLFATQMMQRIQDQNVSSPPHASTTVPNPAALANTSTREIAESLYDGTGANGTFLDGIIRSSLEMGIPGSSNKSQGEDKTLTPENMSNKALLDQLCRNSRLTPLPKPNLMDPQSSGDESSSYHSKRTQSPINFSRDYSDNKLDNAPVNFSSGGRSPKMEMDRYKRNSTDVVELSNDSSESAPTLSSDRKRKHSIDNHSEGERSSTTSPSPASRIYVKPQFQEITKPENLKPEVLVRYNRLHDTNFSDIGEQSHNLLSDRNGIKETVDNIESASVKPEAGQD